MAAGIVLLAAACSEPEGRVLPAAEAGIPVTVQTVRPSPWRDTLQSLGTAKARESVTLTAKVSEIVESLHFESGDEVRAGAPLVTLRGAAQRAALEQAQATAAEAERLYQRQRELAEQQLIARSTLDTQLAIRDAARAQVAQMRSDIGDRVVRAPFSGVLGIRQVSPGSLITPTTVIATLDDISSMYVDFQLPEATLASVQVGDDVAGTVAAWPGREFEGTVSTIDARIDPATRAITVRATFPNPERTLRPGMLVDVRLFRPERQALVIPEIAVVQVARESFVYRVLEDDTVEQASIQTGARRAGQVEIVDGIAAGDRIVVDGTGKLRPGAKVRDAGDTAAPADADADAGAIDVAPAE